MARFDDRLRLGLTLETMRNRRIEETRMTEVPFAPIGPGQSARLVYQVMGGNGPIANPRGIRFMDPGSVDAGSLSGGGGIPGLFSAVGAVQMLDLGIGIANLG